MKKQTLFFFLLAVLFIFPGAECRKQQNVCTGNCTEIHVMGIAVDKLTGQPAANVPFTLKWGSSQIVIGPETYIYEGTSGTDGHFDFAVSIDTTRFKDYSLTLRVKDNDSYMPDNAGADSLLFNGYQSQGFQNLKLNVYPAINLTLQLNRQVTDSAVNVLIEYNYDARRTYQAYSSGLPGTFKPHSETIKTAAGVATTITTRKGNAAGGFSNITDSITCREGAVNVLMINF